MRAAANCWPTSTRPRPRSPRAPARPAGCCASTCRSPSAAAPGAAVGAVHARASEGHARRHARRPRGRSGGGRLRPGGAHRAPAEFVAGQPSPRVDAAGAVRLTGLPAAARHGRPIRPIWHTTTVWPTACSRWATSWEFDGPRGRRIGQGDAAPAHQQRRHLPRGRAAPPGHRAAAYFPGRGGSAGRHAGEAMLAWHSVETRHLCGLPVAQASCSPKVRRADRFSGRAGTPAWLAAVVDDTAPGVAGPSACGCAAGGSDCHVVPACDPSVPVHFIDWTFSSNRPLDPDRASLSSPAVPRASAPKSARALAAAGHTVLVADLDIDAAEAKARPARERRAGRRRSGSTSGGRSPSHRRSRGSSATMGVWTCWSTAPALRRPIRFSISRSTTSSRR